MALCTCIVRHEVPEIVRFVIVGMVNTAFGYGVIFALMLGAGWSPEASNVTGYAVGLAVSYLLHRVFTFRSKGNPFGEAGRFLVVFGIAFGLNLVALSVCVRLLDIPAWISQIIAACVYVVSSYLMQRYFVFLRKHGPA